ncbi:MAG: response regulator [Candidatus Riflebacteria bacterium]|nr:response regulator [Candidatus Riflebacteria bacterium]
MSGDETKIILLVEDEPTTRASVSLILEKFGYKVRTANSGEEAVALISANNPVDLILMDMNLGMGMEGTEAAQQIVAIRNIPVVFHTSHTDREVIKKVHGITRYGYVVKSSGTYVLLGAIEMAFELFAANQKLENKMEELHEREALYRSLSEASPLGIFQANLVGNWIYANNILKNMLDIGSEEIIGQLWRQSIHPDDRKKFFQEWEATISEKRKFSLDFRLQKPNGDILWIHGLASPITGSSGRVHGFVGTMENTTEIKQTQDQLEKARESNRVNQIKNQFLTNVSHEIRTPMNSILANCRLAQKEELSPRLNDFLKTINDSSVLLLKLLNDILDLSKIESGNFELEKIPFLIHEVLDQVYEMLSNTAIEKGLILSYFISPKIPRFVLGDPLRFQQILVNLVGNALKFTNEGSVEISIDLDEIVGNTAQLRIEVIDTGIGIPPDHLERLFSLFSQGDSSTTRKYGGTGLGLAICKRLIMIKGGSISVNSQVGKGTTFTVKLPLEQYFDEDTKDILLELSPGTSLTRSTQPRDRMVSESTQDISSVPDHDVSINPENRVALEHALREFSELICKHDLSARSKLATIRELSEGSEYQKTFAQIEACLKRLDFKKAANMVEAIVSNLRISPDKENI